jgi:hypothetical protein
MSTVGGVINLTQASAFSSKKSAIVLCLGYFWCLLRHVEATASSGDHNKVLPALSPL